MAMRSSAPVVVPGIERTELRRKPRIAAGLRATASPDPGLPPETPGEQEQHQSTAATVRPICLLKGRRSADFSQGQFALFAHEIKDIASKQLHEHMNELNVTADERAAFLSLH